MLLASALMLAGSASAQNTAESLFKSGKAAFEAYDKDLGTMQLSPDKVDKDQMAANLLKGFADFQEALPLDSVKKLNKDGSLKKIETKYSKKIVPILCAHIGDLLTVGDNYYQAQKNAEASAVYGKYCQLIKSPMAIENKVVHCRYHYGSNLLHEGSLRLQHEFRYGRFRSIWRSNEVWVHR